MTSPIATGSWGSVYAARRADNEEDGAREQPGIQGDAANVVDTNSTVGTVSDGDGDGDGDGETNVAIKFLPSSMLTPGRRGLFTAIVDREVRFSRRANHPNIVRTFEIVTLHSDDPLLDGAVCLVMERAAGSLAHRWSAVAEAESARIVRQAEPRGILLGVAEALRNIHESGWVHADLKPSNILINADGDARIADFGLSSELDGTHAYAPPRAGSWEHVPPEWWSERLAPSGTPVRTSQDVWAFGVIVHQVLTDGVHPFPGATASARAETVRAYGAGLVELQPAPVIPTQWAELIRACLDRDPSRRPSAADVADRVRALPVPGSSALPAFPEKKDDVVGHGRRLRRGIGAAVAVVLTCGVAGGLWTAGVIGSGTSRTGRPAVVSQPSDSPHPLQIRVDRDCKVSTCTLRQPVLFLTSGASPSGIVETTVAGPDGVDRNTAKPGAYNPFGRTDGDGKKTGRWAYEAGDPFGMWTVTVRDVQTGVQAVTTFRILDE
ncbi:serine/threonine-protein kinase [Candidatus Protofrankia californiensis]|uniref:serine/threonine-protein kinase n=1 Tax=Candidatus Protofrankia californiensis TaxID=1839754 RepID=UPI0013EBFEF8|nr:serine/threonine-protein kinase [Candidatus Protofrankia californiensis]